MATRCKHLNVRIRETRQYEVRYSLANGVTTPRELEASRLIAVEGDCPDCGFHIARGPWSTWPKWLSRLVKRNTPNAETGIVPYEDSGESLAVEKITDV